MIFYHLIFQDYASCFVFKLPVAFYWCVIFIICMINIIINKVKRYIFSTRVKHFTLFTELFLILVYYRFFFFEICKDNAHFYRLVSISFIYVTLVSFKLYQEFQFFYGQFYPSPHSIENGNFLIILNFEKLKNWYFIFIC